MTPPTVTPAPFRPRRKRFPGAASAAPPPAALTLVAATYSDNAFLDLTFDHPIDIGAIDGEGILVDDAADALLTFNAVGGATLTSATTVRLGLVEFENAAGTGIRLSAPATTGIVAVDGGAAWAGCSGLALPFP